MRQRAEIQAFKPEEYWSITAFLKADADDSEFSAKLFWRKTEGKFRSGHPG